MQSLQLNLIFQIYKKQLFKLLEQQVQRQNFAYLVTLQFIMEFQSVHLPRTLLVDMPKLKQLHVL